MLSEITFPLFPARPGVLKWAGSMDIRLPPYRARNRSYDYGFCLDVRHGLM
jgi:hypothetical protein